MKLGQKKKEKILKLVYKVSNKYQLIAEIVNYNWLVLFYLHEYLTNQLTEKCANIHSVFSLVDGHLEKALFECVVN